MNKNLILPILGVSILIIGYYLITSNQKVAEDTSPEISESSSPTPGVEADLVSPTLEDLIIEAVDGTNSSAYVTRDTVDGTYVFTMESDIDPAAEDKFYEGWVVKRTLGIVVDFVSTGILEQSKTGEHSLEFRSERDLSDYDEIVLTEETLADGLDNKPERHILEGTFGK